MVPPMMVASGMASSVFDARLQCAFSCSSDPHLKLKNLRVELGIWHEIVAYCFDIINYLKIASETLF